MCSPRLTWATGVRVCLRQILSGFREKSFLFSNIDFSFLLIWDRNATSNVTYESTEVHTSNSGARAWGLPHFLSERWMTSA